MLTSISLYEKVNKLRIEKQMSVAELYKKAGISHATLHYWKQRETMPTIEVLEAISEALNVSLSTLLFDVEEDKLTGNEIELISLWRQLSDDEQQTLISFIKTFTK